MGQAIQTFHDELQKGEEEVEQQQEYSELLAKCEEIEDVESESGLKELEAIRERLRAISGDDEGGVAIVTEMPWECAAKDARKNFRKTIFAIGSENDAL